MTFWPKKRIILDDILTEKRIISDDILTDKRIISDDIFTEKNPNKYSQDRSTSLTTNI